VMQSCDGGGKQYNERTVVSGVTKERKIFQVLVVILYEFKSIFYQGIY
jgi:hypothetical protein